MKKLLGIVVLGLLWFSIGYAHQPVLNDTNPISFESPYIIEKPEISKAIYTTLNGKPHIYKISSDKSFKIYESPGNMAEIMGKSDLGIFSSGLTQYEASAVGLPAIVISLNDYHKQVVDEYAKMDSIISFGILNSSKTKILEKTISNLINDQYLRKKMSINGKKIFFYVIPKVIYNCK